MRTFKNVPPIGDAAAVHDTGLGAPVMLRLAGARPFGCMQRMAADDPAADKAFRLHIHFFGNSRQIAHTRFAWWIASSSALWAVPKSRRSM